MKRKAISKKLRFEIFKRDCFKCRYCGRSPLDHQVVLALDHVVPHSEGGPADLVNLVTSCEDCNSGKSDRRLSDDAVIRQTVAEMKALQERQNQVKQMVKWRQSLMVEKDTAAGEAVKFWDDLTPGWATTPIGAKKVRAWVRKFGLDAVLEAMTASSEQYLLYDENSAIIRESIHKAFSFIARICSINEQEKEQPGIKRLHYVKGIMRNRFNLRDYELSPLLEALKEAVADGESIDTLQENATKASSYAEFWRCLGGAQ